jgi:predicted nucleotidyltransferase
MNFGLPQSTIELIKKVLVQYVNVEEVLIFGSRVKGDFKSSSDIDLTIKGNIDHPTLLRLENELDDLLLPYTIDLLLYHKITNRDLIAHIDRIGLTFYRK